MIFGTNSNTIFEMIVIMCTFPLNIPSSANNETSFSNIHWELSCLALCSHCTDSLYRNQVSLAFSTIYEPQINPTHVCEVFRWSCAQGTNPGRWGPSLKHNFRLLLNIRGMLEPQFGTVSQMSSLAFQTRGNQEENSMLEHWNAVIHYWTLVLFYAYNPISCDREFSFLLSFPLPRKWCRSSW